MSFSHNPIQCRECYKIEQLEKQRWEGEGGNSFGDTETKFAGGHHISIDGLGQVRFPSFVD